MTGMRPVDVIARIARRSLATDENGGDFTESLEAILHVVTDGEQGKTWGIVESVTARPDHDFRWDAEREEWRSVGDWR